MLHAFANTRRPSNTAITRPELSISILTIALSSMVAIGFSGFSCIPAEADQAQQANAPSPSPSAYSKREQGSTVIKRSDGSVTVEDDWAPFSSEGNLATPSAPSSYVPPTAPATTRSSGNARSASSPTSRNYSDYVPVTTHTSGGMKTYTTGWSYVGDEGGGSSGAGYIGSGTRARRPAVRQSPIRTKPASKSTGQRVVRSRSAYQPLSVRRHSDGTIETSEGW